jgi:uncharacterized protein
MAIKTVYSTEELPHKIPLLLLRGAILLPRSHLPLPIIEKTNLGLVAEALRTNQFIGLVQPNTPLGDRSDFDNLSLFSTGTLGRIQDVVDLDEDKLLVTLAGISRFTILDQHYSDSDYPIATVSYEGFETDLAEEADILIDRPRLLKALEPYFNHLEITANWEEIQRTPNDKLLTALMMVCPFEPNEKQALLESKTLKEQSKVITTLFEMAALESNHEHIVYH